MNYRRAILLREISETQKVNRFVNAPVDALRLLFAKLSPYSLSLQQRSMSTCMNMQLAHVQLTISLAL